MGWERRGDWIVKKNKSDKKGKKILLIFIVCLASKCWFRVHCTEQGQEQRQGAVRRPCRSSWGEIRPALGLEHLKIAGALLHRYSAPEGSGPARVRVCGLPAAVRKFATGRQVEGSIATSRASQVLVAEFATRLASQFRIPLFSHKEPSGGGDSVCSLVPSQSCIGAVCYENSNQMASLCRNQWIHLSVPFHF